MTDAQKHRNEAQQRLLAVLTALANHAVEGASATTISVEAEVERTQAFRALCNLEIAGWAEQGPGGAWRVTPLASLLAEKIRRELADIHSVYLDPLASTA